MTQYKTLQVEKTFLEGVGGNQVISVRGVVRGLFSVNLLCGFSKF